MTCWAKVGPRNIGITEIVPYDIVQNEKALVYFNERHQEFADKLKLEVWLTFLKRNICEPYDRGEASAYRIRHSAVAAVRT